MIPEIGLMVGAYIVTRMFSFILRKDERKEPPFVVILSGLTILVTVIVVIDLLFRGVSLPNY